MKQLAYIFLVTLLVACNSNDEKVMPDDENPKSNWGKPATGLWWKANVPMTSTRR